eukprot:7850838-Heterocapsa_arctica.AAC.1
MACARLPNPCRARGQSMVWRGQRLPGPRLLGHPRRGRLRPCRRRRGRRLRPRHRPFESAVRPRLPPRAACGTQPPTPCA